MHNFNLRQHLTDAVASVCKRLPSLGQKKLLQATDAVDKASSDRRRPLFV